jgi:phospholipid-binding lipoprotein MlaA
MRALIAAAVVATACLATPATAFAQDDVYDPYEPMNRRLFAAHEAIDGAVLEPLARGYRRITNPPVRRGVSNFLRNLRAPVIFLNDVLQGEVSRAGTTAARFGVNTTVGVLGIMDPAERMGLERHDEDFGQTLAKWGVSSGPYIFVPVLGPTNLRDGAGRVVDMAFDPLRHAEFDANETARVTRGVATGLAAREAVLEEVESIHDNSVDPYVTFRTSYGLWRYSAIQNGRRDVQDLPEFEEIPEDAATDEMQPTLQPNEGVEPLTDPMLPELPEETPPSLDGQEYSELPTTGVFQ